MTAQSTPTPVPARASRTAIQEALEESLREARVSLERLRAVLGPLNPSAGSPGSGAPGASHGQPNR